MNIIVCNKMLPPLGDAYLDGRWAEFSIEIFLPRSSPAAGHEGGKWQRVFAYPVLASAANRGPPKITMHREVLPKLTEAHRHLPHSIR